jgi:hypothetical protein
MAPLKIPYPDHGQGIAIFSACCLSHPLDPQTSAAVLRNLRLQITIDNLLDAAYEQVLGFSQLGIGGRGGVIVNFRAYHHYVYERKEGEQE